MNNYELNAPQITKLESINGGVNVSWEEIEGAQLYRVFRREGTEDWLIIGDTSEIKYLDDRIETNHVYTYSVRCVDNSGEKYLSDIDENGQSIKYLDTPSLQAIKRITDGIELKWERVPGADKYRVFHREEGGNWEMLADFRFDV